MLIIVNLLFSDNAEEQEESLFDNCCLEEVQIFSTVRFSEEEGESAFVAEVEDILFLSFEFSLEVIVSFLVEESDTWIL